MIYGEYHISTKEKLAWTFSFVLWYVDRTTMAAVDGIPIGGSASYTHVLCRLYDRTRFSSTWCIISMIDITCGFPGEVGLSLIPY